MHRASLLRLAPSVTAMLCLCLLAACGAPGGDPAPSRNVADLAAITFVQANYACPQSSTSTVSVPFKAAQSAGDLAVIAVGWNDTSSAVTSVTDSAGNRYRLALGPTSRPGELSQSVYYASGIVASAAGANVVTVKFNRAAVYVDVRVLEYAGLDPASPLDVTAAATGGGSTSSTPSVTVGKVPALIFAANMVTSITSRAGTGYTARVITQPDGDIAQDRIVTATGTYAVNAAMSAGDWVMQAVVFQQSGSAPDTTPPTAPASVVATATSQSHIDLTWAASTDDVGVTGYRVERCQGAGCTSFVQVGTPTATSFASDGLAAGTAYSFRVRAVDAAQNASAYSATATATTKQPDGTPPSSPTGLHATAVSSSEIDLSWTASTDDTGVVSYGVSACSGAGCTSFAPLGTTAGTTFAAQGLLASTPYTFRVTAADGAGNTSPPSSTVSATTRADTTPPSAPSSLVARAVNGARIDLSWAAATDDVGVAAYHVERCAGAGCQDFALLVSTTQLTYGDASASVGTTYSYRVRAVDAAGNPSAPSNIASARIDAGSGTVPAVVQRVAWGALFSGQGLSADSFTFRLPNRIQPGNCGVLFVDYDHGVTLTVSDDGSNPWPPRPDASVDSGAGNMKTEAFVLQGAVNGNARVLTLKFSGKVSTLHPLYVEYDNCRGVGATASTAAAVAPSIRTPAITPAAGSRVLQYAMQNPNRIGQQGTTSVTRWTAGAGWELEAADHGNGNSGGPVDMNPYALQQQIAAGTTLTPTLSTTGTSSYASIALELAAAAGGVAPPDPDTGGVYVKRMTYLTNTNINQNPWVQPFPSEGKTLVITDVQGILQHAPTDSHGNTWTLQVKGNQNATVSASYAKNARPGPDLTVNLPMDGSPSRNTTVWLLDVTGADTSAPLAQSVVVAPELVTGNFSGHPVITPQHPGSLLIAVCAIGIGPLTGLTSPPGGLFMPVLYPGETDFDTFNNADGYVIEYVGSSTAQRNFSWSFGGSQSAYTTGLEIKAAGP
jgi:fibronectin type 3 domain-containing protein